MSAPSDAINELPIIDISPYMDRDGADDSARLATSEALHDACVNYGFFYLDISKFINSEESEELARLAREFFALPQEVKDKISIRNQDHARGYQRLKENVTNGKADNHEAIDFYKSVERPDRTRPLWGENQWPEVPEFRPRYTQWIEKMKMLGMLVMEAMAVGLGMTTEEWDDLRNQVDDSFWVMRIIGYPPLPNDHDGFSCGAHKDYGCLTLLYADPTRSALQVFLRQSGDDASEADDLPSEQDTEQGTWINADPIPGCIVCNIGEMWEIWSNGLYKSTLHRVIHKSSNYRVSIPFFFEPNFAANVAPLSAALRIQGKDSVEGLTDGKAYSPVVYGDFLLSKVSENFATEGKGKYD
ncbi:Clavaminate synthase-like protein [Hygrophoropsis aurantiaca]|uniref:Clavaminate synthase-like protein n=1 Tax=Hygrophoropsis aurantiaca TaxID=72124 RepID=A0ACB8A7K1_9AGAM|nr:Clavaminate synthase-like protein [Hygrophoropsis aurantiaca]